MDDDGFGLGIDETERGKKDAVCRTFGFSEAFHHCCHCDLLGFSAVGMRASN